MNVQMMLADMPRYDYDKEGEDKPRRKGVSIDKPDDLRAFIDRLK